MKVCICDDIEEYRISIRNKVEQYFKDHFISYYIDEYFSANQLLDSDKLIEYNLFFLDIELGEEITGLDLIDKIREKNKKAFFIIITAYNHYLDRAMDLNVLRFIEKPINHNRLMSAIEKSMESINNSSIIVKLKNGERVAINKQDIIYAEAKFKQSHLVTTKGIISLPVAFKKVKELLCSSTFLIPHNSYIVNSKYIISYKRTSFKVLVNNSEVVIPIAATKQSEINKQVHKFVF